MGLYLQDQILYEETVKQRHWFSLQGRKKKKKNLLGLGGRNHPTNWVLLKESVVLHGFMHTNQI